MLLTDAITYPWYVQKSLHTDIDVYWIFDYKDYLLIDESVAYTLEDIQRAIENTDSEQSGSLHDEKSDDILLMGTSNNYDFLALLENHFLTS